MRIDVDKKVLKKSTDCKNDFSCLSSTRRNLCRARSKLESNDGQTLVFCEPTSDAACSYKKPFGDFCVCSCPTRAEIYNRYNI